jgi:drug/metabolite transporter (DMT)-like permease
MDLIYVGLALISAVLHAGWNAAVKARPNTAHAMTVQMSLAALFMLPILVFTGLPSVAALPWIILSTAINIIALTAMLKSYDYAGFGLVYPIARALSVLLVVPGAAIVFGERLGLSAIAGTVAISMALGLLAVGRRDGSVPVVAWGWIVLTGVMTAANVLVDAQGVRVSGSAIAYGCCTSALNAAVMMWRQRRSALTLLDVQREAAAMALVAVASVVSYLLILYVYTVAPVAPASALRDTSALFAVVIAVIWLKERLSRTQCAALVLAALAIPFMRLG